MDPRMNVECESQYVPIRLSSVGMLHKNQIGNASLLCIYNIASCLDNSTGTIGAVYDGSDPLFYFYFKTNVCPGPNYLLNLYVYHSKTGTFSLGISKTSKITELSFESSHKECILDETLDLYTFKSVQPDKCYYIKTFCFNYNDFKMLEQSTLSIPIKIVMNPIESVDKNIITQIKKDYGFSSLLKKREMADFELISASGSRYRVHKTFVAACSPVLRDLMRHSTDSFLVLEESDEVVNAIADISYNGVKINSETSQEVSKAVVKYNMKNILLF